MADADIGSKTSGACMKSMIVSVLTAEILLIFLVSFPIPGEASPNRRPKHESAVCADCHSLQANINTTYIPAAEFERRCRDCHADIMATASASGLGFHSNSGRSCLACHLFHDQALIKAGQARFRIDTKDTKRQLECQSCHNQVAPLDCLSEGHRAAAGLYHSDLSIVTALSPSEKCLLCHSLLSDYVPGDELRPSQPRFAEHATHPLGTICPPGLANAKGIVANLTDSSIVLFDNKIECQTCHSLGSRSEHLLVKSNPPGSLCLSCHPDKS